MDQSPQSRPLSARLDGRGSQTLLLAPGESIVITAIQTPLCVMITGPNLSLSPDGSDPESGDTSSTSSQPNAQIYSESNTTELASASERVAVALERIADSLERIGR